jgi:hypothetical protein
MQTDEPDGMAGQPMDPVQLARLLTAAAVCWEARMRKERLRNESAVLLTGVDPEHRAELAAAFSKLDAEACQLIDDAIDKYVDALTEGY